MRLRACCTLNAESVLLGEPGLGPWLVEAVGEYVRYTEGQVAHVETSKVAE